MTMVCGLDLHRRQITFDALEVESGQVWTGRVWQPDRERFRRWLRDDVTERARWWSGGDRRGGLHRLALRRRGGGRRWVRGASGGAGRHAGGAWSQAARQDRSQRLSVVARAAAERPVAGVVDPADDRVGVARTGAAVQDVGRSTLDVGAADPRRAVSARGDAAGDVDPLGEDPRAARRRRTRDQSGGPATGADGVSDDRRHHRRVATVEGRPATLRSTSARLSGAGRQPVRDRRPARRRRCGPSSATANASPAPNRWCATAAST